MTVAVVDGGAEGHTTFLVHLRPTRPDWPQERTDDETRCLGEHFALLQRLTLEGTCVVAGPTSDASLGVEVLDGVTVDEVVALLEADAMVAAGHFTAEVRAFRLSLER